MLSKKKVGELIRKLKPLNLLPVIFVLMIVVTIGITSPNCWADGRGKRIEFDDTAIFLELNDTDGDLGIQLFWDAEGWKEVEVKDPEGEEIFEVENDEGLREIGSTELSTESAEPEFDELPPEDFLALFDEGEYKFKGKTVEGKKLRGEAELTHVLPAAPVIDSPAEGEAVDPDDLIVKWFAVTGSHPEIGTPDPNIELTRYQLIVEFEDEVTEGVFEFKVDILADPGAEPGDTIEVTVSPEFFGSLEDREGEYKLEVIAEESSGNKTITEQEFELAD